MKHPVCVVVSKENIGGEECVGYKDVLVTTWGKTYPMSDANGNFGEKLLTHGFLMDSFRKLMGRTLTLIDSSVTSEKQNKAMKDIVRGIFSGEMEFAADMCFDQKILTKQAEEAFDGLSDDEIPAPISVEEVLGVEESK